MRLLVPNGLERNHLHTPYMQSLRSNESYITG